MIKFWNKVKKNVRQLTVSYKSWNFLLDMFSITLLLLLILFQFLVLIEFE